MLERIVSGGQTGVDRGALDAALAAGLPLGGWCPRGRRAEDGVIPARYPLRESESHRYAQRTEWNVRDSDGTLILTRAGISGGTALTARLAKRYGRPLLVVTLSEDSRVDPVLEWLRSEAIRVLNVAGPRESAQPGIQRQAAAFLQRVFRLGGLVPPYAGGGA
jgi:hypothetical protein